jgi:hypothetical protein
MNPTPEQIHILDLAKSDNLAVTALAGTGKSTTLELIEANLPKTPVLYICFGRHDLDRARKRVRSTTVAKNFNGLGHGIWGQHIGSKLVLEVAKISNIIKTLAADAKPTTGKEINAAYWAIRDGVEKAKAFGYVPDGHVLADKSLATWREVADALDETPDPFVKSLVDKALSLSITQAHQGTIDFNDQVYMPAVFGGTFPRFPVVLGDEAQDWNNVNWVMYDKLTKSGRGIIVGDPYQSIYVFRGATPGGMQLATARHSMQSATLSVSFRCPEAVVRHVHYHVPNFKWHKPGGRVGYFEELSAGAVSEATFICRNNAPLFKTALQFLIWGHSVNVAGSDLGPRLTGIMRKFGNGSLPQAQVLSVIDSWHEARDARGSKSARDIADCLRVFAKQGDNLAQAIAYAEYLFTQDGQITFNTGHKSKGREWNTVFVLDKDLLGDDDQERNLAYVMATRSANELYYVNSNTINK